MIEIKNLGRENWFKEKNSLSLFVYDRLSLSTCFVISRDTIEQKKLYSRFYEQAVIHSWLPEVSSSNIKRSSFGVRRKKWKSISGSEAANGDRRSFSSNSERLRRRHRLMYFFILSGAAAAAAAFESFVFCIHYQHESWSLVSCRLHPNRVLNRYKAGSLWNI